MKVVVSNSSPICYLILINQIHIMHEILGAILIPEAVARELGDNAAPKSVKEWIAKPPEWVSIQKAPYFMDAELDRLHAGEREAITLAHSTRAEIVVIDEKAARKIAKAQGLNVTGLLGILDKAASLDMIDLIDAVEKLRQTSFRVSPQMLKSLIYRHYSSTLTD